VLTVLKSGSLILLEPSGPVQACNGIALPYLLLLGAELPLMVESFGLLNDLFPFPSILDAGYPVFNLHLANILFTLPSCQDNSTSAPYSFIHLQ